MATRSGPKPDVLKPASMARARPGAGPPWPIWVIASLLALEGVGNLLDIPWHSMAAWWLAAKVLFVSGLLRGWRWVYILFLLVAGYHVLGFGPINLIASALNLLIIVLAASSARYYFPGNRPWPPGKGPNPYLFKHFDPEFDA